MVARVTKVTAEENGPNYFTISTKKVKKRVDFPRGVTKLVKYKSLSAHKKENISVEKRSNRIQINDEK